MTAKEILSWARDGLIASYQKTAASQAADLASNTAYVSSVFFDLRHSALDMNIEALRRISELGKAWRDFKLLPGDTVYMVFEDLEQVGVVGVDTARVTGVGFEGFTIPAELDNPDDMGDLIRWSELGDSYFLTPEEAEADRAKRQKAIEEARE